MASLKVVDDVWLSAAQAAQARGAIDPERLREASYSLKMIAHTAEVAAKRRSKKRAKP